MSNHENSTNEATCDGNKARPSLSPEEITEALKQALEQINSISSELFPDQNISKSSKSTTSQSIPVQFMPDDVQIAIDDIIWIIIKHRKRKGWTQKDLAKKVNVSTATIARMESYPDSPEGTNPSLRLVIDCLNKLGLKLKVEES